MGVSQSRLKFYVYDLPEYTRGPTTQKAGYALSEFSAISGRIRPVRRAGRESSATRARAASDNSCGLPGGSLWVSAPAPADAQGTVVDRPPNAPQGAHWSQSTSGDLQGDGSGCEGKPRLPSIARAVPSVVQGREHRWQNGLSVLRPLEIR